MKWDSGKGRVTVEGRDSEDWMAVDMGECCTQVLFFDYS